MFFWKRKKENSSSCEERSRKTRELLLLLAGLALTLTAIFLARQRINAAEREVQEKVSPVEIVVPSIPIRAGETFSEENISKKPVPATGISSRNVPASEFELLIGARAKGNLDPGEPILWTDVEEPFDAERFSLTIPAGRRAFTIEVNTSASFAGLIRAGDIVDLLCERESGKASQSWIRAIPVISVDRHFGKMPSKEESRDIATVTVSVSPDEGRRLAAAGRDGRIHWFLRNPTDNVKHAVSPALPPKPTEVKVEIWKAGIQERYPAIAIGEPG